MRLLLKLGVYAGAVYLAAVIVSGLTVEGDWVAFVVLGLILGGVNLVVKPIVKLFSFPFILLTLGLFLLVINTLMLRLAIEIAQAVDVAVDVTGWGATFMAALLISIVVWLGEAIVDRD